MDLVLNNDNGERFILTRSKNSNEIFVEVFTKEKYGNDVYYMRRPCRTFIHGGLLDIFSSTISTFRRKGNVISSARWYPRRDPVTFVSSGTRYIQFVISPKNGGTIDIGVYTRLTKEVKKFVVSVEVMEHYLNNL